MKENITSAFTSGELVGTGYGAMRSPFNMYECDRLCVGARHQQIIGLRNYVCTAVPRPQTIAHFICFDVSGERYSHYPRDMAPAKSD